MYRHVALEKESAARSSFIIVIIIRERASTGCFRFIDKKLELITQAKKQPSSSDRSHFFLLIGTF